MNYFICTYNFISRILSLLKYHKIISKIYIYIFLDGDSKASHIFFLVPGSYLFVYLCLNFLCVIVKKFLSLFL